jgi:hypothetical protein
LLHEAFPGGLSAHGRYAFHNQPTSFNEMASVGLELIFEQVRRARFPDRPSRLTCQFACETVAEARYFRQRARGGLGLIWEIEGTSGWKGDMNLCIWLGGAVKVFYYADVYWSGGTLDGNPHWEHLLPLPVTPIACVDSEPDRR